MADSAFDGETGPPASLEETRAKLSAGIDKARRLVEHARFMLGGENDESPA